MLIEDLRNEMHAEIRTARQSARRAEREVETERTKYFWGQKNPRFALEANFQVMGEYLAQAGIQISEDALDLASRACRHQLAERVIKAPEPTAEEKRIAHNDRLKAMSIEELRKKLKADIARNLAEPRNGGYGSTPVLDFSAQQFKRMSPSQVFAVLRYPNGQKRPGAEEAVNLLLQNEVLLQSQSQK